MTEPVVVEISDIVGQFAHRSYFVQLRDSNFYHYPTDKIYTLIVVRPELEQPMIDMEAYNRFSL